MKELIIINGGALIASFWLLTSAFFCAIGRRYMTAIMRAGIAVYVLWIAAEAIAL